MSVHWFRTSVLFSRWYCRYKQSCSKGKGALDPKSDPFQHRGGNGSFLQELRQHINWSYIGPTDLITFSYTIKLPYESIPGYDTMYERNQGIKINVLLIFTSSFITNILSGGSRLRNFPPIQNNWKSLS